MAKSAVALKNGEAKKEALWRVNLRGWREQPWFSIVAPGDTKDEAVRYAKEMCAESLKNSNFPDEKVPAVATVKPLDGAYRVPGKDGSMYMLVKEVLVRDKAKRGTKVSEREWGDQADEVGFIRCEFHSAKHINHGEAGACTVFVSHDKNGLHINYIDDEKYQRVPKSTNVAVQSIFWPQIAAEMKAAVLREKGIKL